MQSMHPVIEKPTGNKLELPCSYLSHSIHMISKLHTAAKNKYEPTYQRKLKDDIQNSFELDKTFVIDSLSPNSTRS